MKRSLQSFVSVVLDGKGFAPVICCEMWRNEERKE
jgi:hypothetical protein